MYRFNGYKLAFIDKMYRFATIVLSVNFYEKNKININRKSFGTIKRFHYDTQALG